MEEDGKNNLTADVRGWKKIGINYGFSQMNSDIGPAVIVARRRQYAYITADPVMKN